MAIPQLTDEQIRTWTLEQKDRWWLANVFRGDMPQLTLRAAVTGFLLGGALSATNLYIGAKTGWTLGVGLTSVILAFAAYRLMARIGVRDMTILENNCTQSIATAAGYMTGPLVSGMTAYMWVQKSTIPLWQMFWFNVVLSVLGVLVAFPMKRRFINDEQQPFPEGRACGVVLDALYTAGAATGMFKAKLLALTALGAGLLHFLTGAAYLQTLHVAYLVVKTGESWRAVLAKYKAAIADTWHLPEYLDEWVYKLAEKGYWAVPALAGVPLKQMGVRLAIELAMVGAGGLMGMRVAMSMLLGMGVNFLIIVPWMVSIGEITPQSGSFATADAVFSRAHILNTWALWWGIAIMVVAAMTSLFARPELILGAFRGLFRRGDRRADVLAHIELPLRVSFVGVPLVGALGVWMAHEWFGVGWIFGASAILLIIVLTLIAANSTALTSITPTGALSKLPQFLFGALDPRHPPTNLMTGVMCVEVASNASNLLMDIKPGYMLGAKPRQQAIGHCIGIVAGALAATPLFYAMFLKGYQPGADIQSLMAPDGGQFSFPSAVQWKGVSDLVTSVFGGAGGTVIARSAMLSMLVAGVVGLIMEIARTRSRGKFPISPLAVGLGVVITPDSTISMAIGASLFALMNRRYRARPGTRGHRIWVDSQEPICAGLIAGWALVGIGDKLLDVFLLR